MGETLTLTLFPLSQVELSKIITVQELFTTILSFAALFFKTAEKTGVIDVQSRAVDHSNMHNSHNFVYRSQFLVDERILFLNSTETILSDGSTAKSLRPS